jgi:predicted Zn finger-like uncharacterized protein
MLIVCPHCATSYQIAPESLGDNGRSVRCASCHSLWFAHPNDAVVHATTAAPEPAAPTLIRPPLNDVVAIGAGTADEPANGRFDDPTDMVPPDDAPSIVPGADTRFDKPKGIERAALAWERKRAKRRPLVLSRHAMPAMIIVLGLVLVCLIAGRQQVVRLLPQTASLYARIGLPVNLRGLAFENIKTTRDIEDGVPILIVEGEVVGTTGRHTEVPRLRFAVTDNTGKEIYAWTARPAKTLLPPDEVLPFRSRLASPPAEASGVTVRFFNRHDAKAGFM